jgi:hypothetical protein
VCDQSSKRGGLKLGLLLLGKRVHSVRLLVSG